MGKYAHSKVMDYGLDYIQANSTRLLACVGQPTNYTHATDLYAGGCRVADVAINATEFSIGDAPGGGRRLAIQGQSNFLIHVSGQVDHVALVKDHADPAQQELLYVTDLTNSQQVTAGNTMTVPAWDIIITNPS